MDSVYDAARRHAEKLKAELEVLQTFLNLHDRFREHFGLTSSEEASAATSEAKTTIIDPAEATHEIHVQAPEVDAEAPVEASVEAPVEARVETPVDARVDGSAPSLSHAPAAESDAVEDDAPPAAAAEARVTASAEGPSELEPRVIKASEGVLMAAPPEPQAVAPLGPEATLQSVAEKLAATIGTTNPTVTGYTV